jgi:conjugative transfer signal peptidase TraF
MKKRALSLTILALAGLALPVVWSPAPLLIWNRTDSAPKGLWRLSDAPFARGRWVVVSAASADSEWAAARLYVGRGWPLLKRISGVGGDVICRTGNEISVNGSASAMALEIDGSGRALPVWEGCFRLAKKQVFLLTDHPQSLDGRYFGATSTDDLEGVAELVFSIGGRGGGHDPA